MQQNNTIKERKLTLGYISYQRHLEQNKIIDFNELMQH